MSRPLRIQYPDAWYHVMNRRAKAKNKSVSPSPIVTIFPAASEKKIRFPNAKDMVGSIDIISDYYDVSDELLHENSEFKSYLKKLSTAKGDFSEEKIRKFSSAFEQARV